MGSRRCWAKILPVVLLALLTTIGSGEGSSRLEKSGTIGFAIFGGYGIVTGDSRFGNDFDDGGSLGIALRYVVGPHWSIGLGFVNQNYDGTSASGLDKAVITAGQVDILYYRDRLQDAAQYLVLGLGFYRPEVHLSDGEVSFPGENFMISAGLGAEIFIGESWGIDLSGRAYGYVGDGVSEQEADEVQATGNFSLGIQGTVGLVFYLLN